MFLVTIISLVNAITAAVIPQQESPVCIIGAGPSGLSVASQLQNKSIPYVIFEKEGFVGGKAQTYVDPSTQIPYFIGPVLVSKFDSLEVVELMEKLNVYQNAYPSIPKVNVFEWRTGFAQSVPRSPVSDAELAALTKYIELYGTYSKYLVPGYTNGVPDELAQPLSSYLRSNQIQVLERYFWEPLTTFGYGSVDVTPTIYGLQLMTPAFLKYIFNVPGFEDTIRVVNFNELFTKFAATLTGEIIVSAQISNIKRDNDGAKIQYSVGGPSIEKKCKSVVMAFPPRMDRLEGWMSLSDKEKAVFSLVETVGYHSGVANAAQMDYETRYVNFLQYNQSAAIPISVGPPEMNGQVVFARHFQNMLSTFYSWSDSNANPNDVRELAKQVLSRINYPIAGSMGSAIPLTDDDIKIFKSWDYFPHVKTEAIKNGFYKNLEKLQGSDNTYWISGLNSFETVGTAVHNAIEFVNTHFTKA